MVQNKARYKERMKEKLEKRRQRLKEGMSKDEVSKMEAEEDKQFEEELKKEASLNPLIKLVVSLAHLTGEIMSCQARLILRLGFLVMVLQLDQCYSLQFQFSCSINLHL